jgi:preprotein translocase subunit SecG
VVDAALFFGASLPRNISDLEMLGILLACHIVVCIGLIGVVLLQRSEGGALGMGGGPSGFMSARGAGDLLTRTTWILATLFFILSLALTVLSGRSKISDSVVDRVKINNLAPSTLNRKPVPIEPTTPGAAPAPFQAPTPAVRNPFGAEPAPSQPAPAKP